MSNKFRKVLAAILAGTMVLGSSVVANAAPKGEGTGEGSLDVVESLDVFSVVLPTDAGTQFDYILDPTGVIAQTNAAKYASSSFVAGKTMYFRQKPASGSDIATYSDVSDPIKAYNKSTMAVEIKVQAKLATPSGIDIVTTAPTGGGPANTATPSIYLALQDGVNADKAITTSGIVATSSIPDASNYYEIVYVGNDVYRKQLNATGSNAKLENDFDGIFKSYSFNLTGSCNDDGKWVGLTEELPSVSLVWTIDKPDGAVEVTDGPQMTLSSTGYITIKGLTADKNYGSLDIDYDDGNIAVGEGTVWDTDNYNAQTGGDLGIQLSDAWRTWLAGQTITVNLTLSDGTSVSATATLAQ